MAIRIKQDVIHTRAQTDSDGRTTVTRKIVYEGDVDDTILNVTTSPLYPQLDSALSQNANFFLDTIELEHQGTTPNLFEANATYKTSNSSTKLRKDQKPWDLGIIDWDINFQDVPIPYTHGYDEKGNWVQNLNSAGSPIVADTTVSMPIITFSFNVKSAKPVLYNTVPVLNKNEVLLNKYTIPKYCGKLMPVGVKEIKVYKNDGTLDYEYYHCSVTILVMFKTWEDMFLDVGTLAIYMVDGKPAKGAIFKYTPWVKKEPEEQIKTVPKFGSIDEVVKAKNIYEKVEKGGFSKLPWEEVTEPMPLNKDGTIFTDAITKPETNPYNTVNRYPCKPVSWTAYGFPGS
ncbi:MAG: hypothetical protein BWY31_01981 [Lentisphaerae bacterium ADurb.Bin242]|nr:MAG: hypothetical protein BWY31_01981 [Lentisphaerae bacterium ADurb.Bin242]